MLGAPVLAPVVFGRKPLLKPIVATRRNTRGLLHKSVASSSEIFGVPGARTNSCASPRCGPFMLS